ncbi:protein SCAI [Amyelois transitella]|uniref:protein SCAI n=1 Tax=Amyelois transitella TaxID=680683 RepID=UPI00067AE282|nr:protein SCAI [Amyelois transitella]
MGRMNPLEDRERKIIIEFCHLLEKSKQLFNGLRELPQYGHKTWHSYFGRTFDVYTKLWKFQQQHRSVLDSKYGLKRWQIGEIASKIGQLYYHFYLRTSDTAYLNEAFSFYYAIRGRCYYTQACKEDKCELMVKKLRYYARFIVVSLLLKKIKLVQELIKELDRQIIEYGNTYDPDDQMEWIVVVDEVKAFIQAEPVVTVHHPDNFTVIFSHRLSPLTVPPVEKSPYMSLSLQEVLIVGSANQVKFSELTMDMFRMLNSLEKELVCNPQLVFDESPHQQYIPTPCAPPSKGYNLESKPRPPPADNPHKYLLFKPTPAQVLVYLASGCYDLPPNGALLLYISADGQMAPQGKHPEDAAYEAGGLITTSKNDVYRENSRQESKSGPSTSKYKELQCLHPGDLYPFTRRPLFIIIESDNSYVFQSVPRHFGQPMIILMSPAEIPPPYQECRLQGSLFTLFLHSPLSAFCLITDIRDLTLSHWDEAMSVIDTFMIETTALMTRSRVDMMFINYMGDHFFRILLLRYVFCEVTLRNHRAFRARSHLPRSSPSLPEEISENPTLIHIMMDLAALLQVRNHFYSSHSDQAQGPVSKE